uniref:G-protein coupled receptors family 1 profile domain-containing protein n=1 Tax=Ornithorhynchus anatinus TaxID=9258 RepID=F6SHJ1_ORNAN
RSRSLRTPANMFIINLSISDFFMSLTQAPVFFASSLHKRWIFGEKGCQLYAFCGALFGITSMITLTVIALDRYFVITRPLASIGVISKKRALLILTGVWFYSLAWSLPPFFGWSEWGSGRVTWGKWGVPEPSSYRCNRVGWISCQFPPFSSLFQGAYVPEGLLTSCSWDYMTFTPPVRAYTMLLFCFVFFIPLIMIIYCYFFIFRAIRGTNKAVETIGSDDCRGSQRQCQRMKNEWKTAKIALMVILLYVISWCPYSVVALVAFAGYFSISVTCSSENPSCLANLSPILPSSRSHARHKSVHWQHPWAGCSLAVFHPMVRSGFCPASGRYC